ncbi:MAG TPA: hypothetical protein VHL57_00645, partial [Flavobacteriales bacterium]|nr:hypothetical protein [Flavobacteriales bacterium]
RSVTTELAAAGPPAFFVSLRGTTNPLFTKELRMWDIGALFSGSDTALSLHRVARDFDALIFVATSTPSVQLSR